MIDLSLLRHFLAVAKMRSFTDAAEQNNVSRPVISRSIKRLEDQLGTSMFERTTRSVTLTPAGEALFAEMEAIMDRIAVLARKVGRIGKGDNASLKIGVCSTADTQMPLVAKAVSGLRMRNPEIDVELSAISRDNLSEALRSAEVDIGFMVLNRSDCRGLEWRVLATSPIMLWVPPSWNVAAPTVKLEQFREETWVLAHPKISPDLLEMQMSLFQSAGFTPRKTVSPTDYLSGQMMRICEKGPIFIHMWDAEGDPSAKAIEGLPGYCFSDMVIAWADGARCALINKFMDQFSLAANEHERAIQPNGHKHGGKVRRPRSSA
ncbi:LysR family transcriptional regulator [Novosphingobium sp.]|uniref:LysR family transcriptional regulator n=1 Tax=Novosphingobium sp. TaxID=1874826 RepID=UPI002FD925C9